MANHMRPEALGSEVQETAHSIFDKLIKDPPFSHSFTYLTQIESCSDSGSLFFPVGSRGSQLTKYRGSRYK